MIKYVRHIIMILVGITYTLPTLSYDFEVDGLCYNKLSNNQVEVTYKDFWGNSYSGSLSIPSSVTYNGSTYTVTAIGASAFLGCSNLTGSLEIPSSITSIGKTAFSNCRGFTGSLIIPSSVISIGNAAFSYCSGFNGSLKIPNSVASIGDATFTGCSGFTGSLIIPSSVTSIGESAFSNCSGFTGSLIIPSSVTSIGSSAFTNCSGFNGSLTIPSSVTSIESYAFMGCSGFTGSLIIPNSVTSIESNAFSYCSGFTGSLIIPNSVTSIGSDAFYGCRGFTGSLTIPSSVTSIGSSAFYGCRGFTGSLTIPSSVTSIGSSAFSNCSGFNGSLTISSSVTSIGSSAFSLCSGFTGSLTIPSSVTSIESYAFMGCSGFTSSLIIPNSVTSIGSEAFSYCSGFTGSLTIPSSITYIGSSAFYGCNHISTVKSWIESPFNISEDVFMGISSNAVLQVPKNTRSKYEAYTGWTKNFSKIVEEGNSATQYILSITASGNGSVSYNGTTIRGKSSTFTVDEGSSATISFNPDNGYRIKDVKVNNSDVTSSISNNQYSVSNIRTNTTLEVEFEAIPAGIDITQYVSAVSIGGAIMQTNNLINSGSQLNWTFSNKSTESVTLNSLQLIDGQSGTAGNIMAVNQVVNANSSVSYTTTIGAAGIHTPVTCRFRYTYNGNEYSTDAVYTGTIEYTLSIKASGNGQISYKGNTIRNTSKSYTVDRLASVTLTITPDDGYKIKNLKVNSRDVTSNVSNNSYTISLITSDQSVEVEFEAIEITTYTLSIKATGNGSASYSGNTIRNSTSSFTVNEGTSVTISLNPDNGYRVKSLKEDGTDVTSNVSNNKYTISNIKKNTTIEVEFQEELKNYTSNGINYTVLSYKDKTINLAKGNYGAVLEVPATITFQDITWNVAGVDDAALANNEELAAIIWNPSVAFTGSVNNPNLLLYVKSASYAPATIKNVVVNSTAESIVLTDAASGNDFYCPKEFTARKISYTHNYGMITGIDECRGWETIALPFDVKKIAHSSKGELTPFANWRSGDSKKPFWLMSYGAGGWTNASNIKANTPYIISMPNNPDYKAEFRLSGNITFSAENVTVKKSDDLQTGNYGGNTFTPNFSNKNNSGYLTLNVNNDYASYTGASAEGSIFVANLRTVHPFEAYMTSSSKSRSTISVNGDMTTGIEDMAVLMDEIKGLRIYNLKGQLIKVEQDKDIDDVKNSLPAGVYIVNGKKLIIK